MYLGKNRVVATARTPAYLLVGSEVFGGKRWQHGFGRRHKGAKVLYVPRLVIKEIINHKPNTTEKQHSEEVAAVLS